MLNALRSRGSHSRSMVSAATTPGWRLAKVGPGAAFKGNSRPVVAFTVAPNSDEGQLHGGRFRGDLHRLTHLPNLHREIKTLLSPYRQRDALLHLRAKAHCRNTNSHSSPGNRWGLCKVPPHPGETVRVTPAARR